MFYRTGRTRSNTLQLAIILLAAASAGATGIIDRAQEIAEHLRSQEFSAEGFEVIELFRAETTEDLEAAITNGYPMPWLAEILEDEAIPEEDRYWLDCRMRSIFAQDLHVFFDRDGNRISVEADFIIPGEDYWREHLMVNPLGESDVPANLRPTTIYADPGYILDRFGNQVGELAEVFRSVTMSRDASIAAVISGGEREPLACFMYPDGTFREVPLPQQGRFQSVVSANGEVIAFECVSPVGTRDPVTFEPTGVVGEAFFYDPNGNLLNRVSPPAIFSGFERCKLSSDGRYFCGGLSTGELFLTNSLSGYTGELIPVSEGGLGRGVFNFSPDGDYICGGGHSSGVINNLSNSTLTWESNSRNNNYDLTRLRCSNGAECIANVTRHGPYTDCYFELEVFIDDQLIFRSIAEERYNEETIVSPNGYFLLSQKDDVKTGDSAIPTVIRHIKREDSE
ncbi:MAG: hypothetical protein U9P42_00735 [Candidatus Fermentibacteria bacterium]|nr:hypothetical protein [Candidatus Fermentibacteria bacterium]